LKHPTLALALLLAGCRQDMHDQPRFEPLEKTTLFSNGASSRNQVPGTIARGELRLDAHLYEGTINGEPATSFPFEVTEQVLERGRERFGIHCAPCHGRSGYGEGMVVKRGLKHPSSFHIDRLRKAPHGYFFSVMTKGFGAMYDVSDRVITEDRWAIIAFIRALQLSQNALVADLPPQDRQRLEGGGR